MDCFAVKHAPFPRVVDIHSEEQEKLNVWVAFLNLENMYGTHESLTQVFERALQHNEPLKVYQQLITIYIHSDKLEASRRVECQIIVGKRRWWWTLPWLLEGLMQFCSFYKPMWLFVGCRTAAQHDCEEVRSKQGSLDKFRAILFPQQEN